MSIVSPLETSIPVVRPERAEPVAGLGSVGQTFEAALREVEMLQRTADSEAEKVALGGGNLHETALALEKADIGMRVATKVRNKLVDAYVEVMRMNV
ncbi:MAG: flagellar hook-basal body complex protein FliE [Myxococcaceae bacterium]|nr:flagellar hook-basal body complex protein FliE [Myxococcaceae bacterium]